MSCTVKIIKTITIVHRFARYSMGCFPPPPIPLQPVHSSCLPSLVADLEEKLHRCEADKHNCVQKVQHLEGQLHTVREELAETLAQLRLLQDVLQRTQTIAEERQVEVEKLSIRLR